MFYSTIATLKLPVLVLQNEQPNIITDLVAIDQRCAH